MGVVAATAVQRVVDKAVAAARSIRDRATGLAGSVHGRQAPRIRSARASASECGRHVRLGDLRLESFQSLRSVRSRHSAQHTERRRSSPDQPLACRGTFSREWRFQRSQSGRSRTPPGRSAPPSVVHGDRAWCSASTNRRRQHDRRGAVGVVAARCRLAVECPRSSGLVV